MKNWFLFKENYIERSRVSPSFQNQDVDIDRDSTPELNNPISPKPANSNFSAGSDNSAQFFSPALSPSQLSPGSDCICLMSCALTENND